jgi:hypothetical protein
LVAKKHYWRTLALSKLRGTRYWRLPIMYNIF